LQPSSKARRKKLQHVTMVGPRQCKINNLHVAVRLKQQFLKSCRR